MRSWYWLVVILGLVIGGCSSKDIIIPLDVAEEAGETARSLGYVVGDASVAKEAAKFKTSREMYEDYTEAYTKSGFTMKYQKMQIGDEMVLLPIISFKQPPVAPGMAEVSEHPVWKTVNNLTGTALRWGFGYLAVDSIVGGYKSISDNAGNHYAGPVQMSGSYNTAGGDQSITTGAQYQDQRTDSDGCSNGNCDGEAEEGIDEMCVGDRGTIPMSSLPEGCSCGSWQNYDC